MIAGIILLLWAILLLVLGILTATGKFDILRTYHQNQDYSKEAYRKAMGICLIIAAVIITAVGVTAFFVDSTTLFLIMVPALALALIPIFIVQKKFNGQIF